MFQTLDFFADLAIPVFAVFLLVLAIFWLRKSAPLFLLRCVVAAALSQQIAKFIQKSEVLGREFPSTHFAVALTLATCFWVLKPKLWPVSLAFVVFYGALMLAIHQLFPSQYHTPLEMVGAFYAIPIALACHFIGRKRENVGEVAAN